MTLKITAVWKKWIERRANSEYFFWTVSGRMDKGWSVNKENTKADGQQTTDFQEHLLNTLFAHFWPSISMESYMHMSRGWGWTSIINIVPNYCPQFTFLMALFRELHKWIFWNSKGIIMRNSQSKGSNVTRVRTQETTKYKRHPPLKNTNSDPSTELNSIVE